MATTTSPQHKYVVLTHCIYGECILGYIDSDFPHLFGVLSASILRGFDGDIYIWSIGRHMISTHRPATEQDFADYRVQLPKALAEAGCAQ